MSAAKREAVIPASLVERLLVAATEELILVGGQALKVWMDRYGVKPPPNIAYVSRDVDFLAASVTDTEAVRRLARTLGGRTVFPRRRAALTALVGQAVKEISGDEVFNVDVVHRVLGADENLRDRAVRLELPNVSFRVMHPLDVLKSRLDNLYSLTEKQNEVGDAQLRAAIDVARAFQREAASTDGGGTGRSRRPSALRYVSFIEQLARGDAGKKVATRRRIHVADAIEPDAVATLAFREKNLPPGSRG